MLEYDKLFEIKDDKKRNEVLKSIGTNNFNNEILRAVQAEKTTEIRKKFFEDLNEYAEEVKDTTGLVYIGWFDNTNTNRLFNPGMYKAILSKLWKWWQELSLYRSTTADEKQAEQEKTEQENKIKEERDSKIRKLKELAERTYTLRRNFVKDFTLNEKATSKEFAKFYYHGIA